MQFRSLSDRPNKFCPVLIRRDLTKALEINGVTHHGITERRSEYCISWYTGRHFLGREAHWVAWSEIPPENRWNPAGLFAPDDLKPVLVILPQPIVMRTFVIPAGICFGMYDSSIPSWKVYQRTLGLRITDSDEITSRRWIDVGKKQISSWLELPPLDERLRSDF